MTGPRKLLITATEDAIRKEDRYLNEIDKGFDFVRVYHTGPRRNAYKLSNYDYFLRQAGLTPGGNETKRSYYYVNERLPHEETLWLKETIRKHKAPLRVVSCEARWGRGRLARGRFFKYNKPGPGGYYRCTYCGANIPKNKIQIDHIFSINNLTHKQTTRDMAATMGIQRSDSPKNLVATCASCNRKKDTKGGGWIALASFGRTKWFWPFLKVTFAALVLAAVAWACYTGLL